MTDLDHLLSLARQKGSDKQFRAWVQKQKSCISGRWSEWVSDIGEWRSEAAHVRRAVNSGTAKKPDYACVPLTRKEHHLQTVKGEAACLNAFLPLPNGELWTNEAAKAWFDSKRVDCLERWIAS